MAEGDSNTISRQALDRTAILGDFYDARTDTFCGTNMFKQQFPKGSQAVSVIDDCRTETSIKSASSLKEKLENLDIKGELKLSILSGMVELRGSAKYLNHEKTSYKSVESSLLYKLSTVYERLELYNTELKSYISDDALRQTTATHVVIQIYYGANCAITVTDKNSESKEQNEVEGNLKVHLEKLKNLLSATAYVEAGYEKKETEIWSKFSIDIFGDILPDKFPHSVDGALSMLKDMEQLVRKYNNGKGKPLKFVMMPLCSPFFQEYLGLKTKSLNVSDLGEGQITRVIKLLDHITELRQKVHDYVVDLNNHSRCVRSTERQEARSLEDSLEVEQGDIKCELVPLLKDVRSGKSDLQCVEAFCDKHRTTADDKFAKCKDIYQAVQSRIMFAEDCTTTTYGAKYLEHPIRRHIDRACNEHENVYVLVDGQADEETTEKNQSAFKELAKGCRNDGTTAFYFTWSDCTGHITIKHYRNRKCVLDDVTKELDTKALVQCIPAARRAFSLKPFKVRCPGSYCSKEERSWTCINCNELLQFCPYDPPGSASLYCGCGHAKTPTHEFQFRCGSEAHGSAFAQFADNELHEQLTSSASSHSNYLFVGCICFFNILNIILWL